LLGQVERRTLSPSGIQLHDLYYNSHELCEIRRQTKKSEKVTVKYDPNDLSIIYVRDEKNKDGRYLTVPAVEQDYTRNLSLWQHRVIKSYARRQADTSVDLEALCRARTEIQKIIERERRAPKRVASAQKMARYMGVGQPEYGAVPNGTVGPASEKDSLNGVVQADLSADKTSSGSTAEGESDLYAIDDAAIADEPGWSASYDLPI
jgi:hypothetical protein